MAQTFWEKVMPATSFPDRIACLWSINTDEPRVAAKLVLLLRVHAGLGHRKRAARARIDASAAIDAVRITYNRDLVRNRDRRAGASVNTSLAGRALLFINLNCHIRLHSNTKPAGNYHGARNRRRAD